MFGTVFLRAARMCGLLAVLAVLLSPRALAAEANDRPDGPPDSRSKQKPNPDRDEQVKAIESRLGRMKRIGTKRKSPDDFFMLATAQLQLADRHANVCFQVIQSEKKVAERVVDYVFEAPENTRRQWYVFARLPDSKRAEGFLEMSRKRFDEEEAFRNGIAKMFDAKTLKRT